jgi:Mrp family chromosome partitioning ATPase
MNEDDLIIEQLIKEASSELKEKKQSGNNNGIHDEEHHLVERPLKPVIFNSKPGKSVNENVVAYHLYNCFNYSLFINNGNNKRIRFALGVTSANPGEGKTTTACNLATALSLSSQRRTVLIDLNTRSPRIHEIFGTPMTPGITDALLGEEICVTPTQIENLAILPAGNSKSLPPNRLINFSLIANSLLQKFEFLVVDLSSVDTKHFPTLIANQLNGIIVVVESNKTKRRDISRLFRRVNEKNIIGFVMNKIKEDDF